MLPEMGENPDLDNGLSLGDDLYLISNRNMHISIANFNIEHPRLTIYPTPSRWGFRRPLPPKKGLTVKISNIPLCNLLSIKRMGWGAELYKKIKRLKQIE